MKLKRGDILINRWAGHIDFRYFIYLSTDKEGINGIVVHDGRFKKVRYYKNHLDVVMSNGKKAYEIVGHTDFLEVAKHDLGEIKKILDIR